MEPTNAATQQNTNGIAFPYINPDWYVNPVTNRTSSKDILSNTINIQQVANTILLPKVNAYAPNVTFDLGVSNYHILSLDGGSALSLTNVKPGQAFAADLYQSVGSQTVTWFSGYHINWPSATAITLSTTAGRRDVVIFKWIAVNTLNAFIAGKNMA